MIYKDSPKALNKLLKAIERDSNTDKYEGATDCPEKCVVEPDGQCPHGYLSATNMLMKEAI
jgi:hypothetical protein